MDERAHGVLEEIRRIARDELGHERPVEASHTLDGDLRLDSLSAVTVVVALEDRFRIRLQEQDAGRLATVEDLVSLVCRRLAEQHPIREGA